MSLMRKKLILGGAFLAVVACATSAILISRASTNAAEGLAQARPTSRIRNLSLQPEAARVKRRLGGRFKFSGQPESILTGTLNLGTNPQPVTIIRRQTGGGEAVEVTLEGRRLTWNDTEGIRAVSGLATIADRLLVERLVLDSPDQFVLAQLRGAGYFTIRRNLRPDGAGDNYSGPLWTLVRVSEPQNGGDTGPKSQWRLYYINQSTELIDRITCEVDGQTVEAGIDWTERNGEKLPSHIKWTMSGQTIMEFELTAFSQNK